MSEIMDLLVSAKRSFKENSSCQPYAAVMGPLTKQKLLKESEHTFGVSIGGLFKVDGLLIVASRRCPKDRIYVLGKRDFIEVIEVGDSMNWKDK